MNIPSFGLGTFRIKDQLLIDTIKSAVAIGYRHFDTAQIYGNEAEVGQALSESALPREQFYVTTKIWLENLGADKLIPSLKESLYKLKTEQVDLALIHWPAPKEGVPVAEYMQALAEAKAQGLTRQIGVSNFTVELLQQAIDSVGATEIATNQIELHPFLQNRSVVDFASKQGIKTTAYMPLAYGKVIEDPTIVRIAQKIGQTPAQVALAWSLQKGYIVIPSSTKTDNLKSNFAAQTLLLSEQDTAAIDALERNERLVSPDFAPAWD